MLGGIFKLTISFSALFLFITLFWQLSITDALPAPATVDNVAKSNEEMSDLSASNSHTGARVVKRSLHLTVDQPLLIDRSHSSARQRHFKKKFSPSNHKKSSSNLFRSTGINNINLRAVKRMKANLDNRLKRFRMLEQDEFQEMLKSLSQQTSEEQSKASDGMDIIGGMQLANYWSPN